MSRRTDLIELMDDPAVDRAALATSLRFIRRINRHLGGTHAVLRHFKQWSANWNTSRDPISILDIATGSADIPLAILNWAHRRHDLYITALDIHATTLSLAQEFFTSAWQHANAPQIEFIQGDALALPFPDKHFDYAISSMFFHHLDNDHAAAALREMIRVSRRGIIINDLLRSSFSRVGIFLLTVLADPIDKHDARVSIKKAWTPAEAQALAKDFSWLEYHYHLPSRFTLAGEKH